MRPLTRPDRNGVILRDPVRQQWLSFGKPFAEWVAHSTHEVAGLLCSVEREVEKRNLHAVGFASYEAASGLDAALRTRAGDPHVPCALFRLYEAPQRFERLDTATAQGNDSNNGWRLNLGEQEYGQRIAAIKRQIALGNTYQVNYTLRQSTVAAPDAWQLFLSMASDAPYAAYLEHADIAIISASPELFFELDGTTLRCRPMKGTANRGLSAQADRESASALQNSAKNRAENVMITDMIRNDLGRIAAPGSVSVESLYDLEKYPTVWQMTSTVSANSSAAFAEIFAALFPCASITGAPKASSMSIIADLEDTPRGIFTGAIGWLAPGRKARFSVAIRTACIDQSSGTGTYGVGGGIVWDSDPADEYSECLAKSAILGQRPLAGSFQLIETLRRQATGEYVLWEYHLDRVQASAEYFDFAFERLAVERALKRLSARLEHRDYRVRLLLARDGKLTLESDPVDARPQATPNIRLAAHPVDANDVFLYHKTTERSVYANALEAAGDVDDVLLWNEDGYLTESTIANIVVRLDGKDYTPPVACGLLAGTMRRYLIENGELTEREISVAELAAADELALINSVRGRYVVQLVR